MKDKTNKWLPWLSSVLIGIIISYALITITDSYSMSKYPDVFLPSTVPSTQVNGISVIESINEFSGDETTSAFYKGARAGITISLILIFVVIPFLFVKGTIQSEKRENPTALWYTGSALMLIIVVMPMIAGASKIHWFQNVDKSSQMSRTHDVMRMELTDVSFIIAEEILEFDDISVLAEFNAENITEIINSEFHYLLVTNPDDSSATITISSDKVNNFTATTIIRPYSDQIFKYQRTY
ncbi:hypothetical protein A8B79_00735 [Balneola sp. EhC07]|jgi:hypothetical protein|uniref:hypothetical protein n=1 Tax=Balneola sp. EhC07 TaxID=1849360 RepID=UPI0007F5380E|nr:hypothetical protein [Balneola sp. EhC07]OAN64704.1 hypothetical protein A8B79_00735 [Balneola sp. EhC07]